MNDNEPEINRFLKLLPELVDEKLDRQTEIVNNADFSIGELKTILSQFEDKKNSKKETTQPNISSYNVQNLENYDDGEYLEDYQMEALENVYRGTNHTIELEKTKKELISEILSSKKIRQFILTSVPPKTCRTEKNPFKDLAKKRVEEISEDEVIKSKKSEGIYL